MGISRIAGPLAGLATLLRQVSIVLASAGFVVVVAAFVWTVWCRYVLGTPSRYGEEIAVVCFLWVVMVGASLGTGLREHVSFDLVTEGLPPRGQAALAGVGGLAAGIVFLAALPVTIDYVMFLWRQTTPALRWRLDLVYACFPLFQGVVGLKLVTAAVAELLTIRGRT